jgi:hypothetical protein
LKAWKIMIRVPRPKKYYDEDMPGDTYPCVICGKPCPNPKTYVWLVSGGTELARPGIDNHLVEESGNMLFYPVGSSCVKLVPKEYRCSKNEDCEARG